MNRLNEVLLDPQVEELLEKDKGHLFEVIPILQSLTIELPGTKNLWKHSKAVCAGVPADPVLRWAALFHDIGKPIVFRSQKTGVSGVFPNHAMIGAEVWRDNSRRFIRIMTKSQIDTVERLVRYHMQPLSYTPQWNSRAVRDLARRYDGDIMLGIELAKADGGKIANLAHLSDRIGRGCNE